MFFSFKKSCSPLEQVEAVFEMFTEEERRILIQPPKIDAKELIIERINKKTKLKYKTAEEAKKEVECLVRLAQLDNNIVKSFDRYDVWKLSDQIYKFLFDE